MHAICSIVRISVVLCAAFFSTGVRSEDDDLVHTDFFDYGRDAAIAESSAFDASGKQALYDNFESKAFSNADTSYDRENNAVLDEIVTTDTHFHDKKSLPAEVAIDGGTTGYSFQNYQTGTFEPTEANREDANNELISKNHHIKMSEPFEVNTDHTSQNDQTKKLETAVVTTEGGNTEDTAQNFNTKMFKATEVITKDGNTENTTQNQQTKMLQTAEVITEGDKTKYTSKKEHIKMSKNAGVTTEDDNTKNYSQNYHTEVLKSADASIEGGLEISESAEETTEGSSSEHTSQDYYTKRSQTVGVITKDVSTEHSTQNQHGEMLETADVTAERDNTKYTSLNDHIKISETTEIITENTQQNYHTEELKSAEASIEGGIEISETTEVTTEGSSSEHTSQDYYTKMSKAVGVITGNGSTEHSTQNHHTEMLDTADAIAEREDTKYTSLNDHIKMSETTEVTTENSYTENTSQNYHTEILKPSEATTEVSITVDTSQTAVVITEKSNTDHTFQNYHIKMSETTEVTTENGNSEFTIQNHTKMSESARTTTEGGNTDDTPQNYNTKMSEAAGVTTEDVITEHASQNYHTKMLDAKYSFQNNNTETSGTAGETIKGGSTESSSEMSQPTRPPTESDNTKYIFQNNHTKIPNASEVTTESSNPKFTPQGHTKMSETATPTTEGGNTKYSSQNDHTKISKASEVTTQSSNTETTSQNDHTKMSKHAESNTESGDTEYTSQNYHTKMSGPTSPTTESGYTEYTSQNNHTKMSKAATEDGNTELTTQDHTKISEPARPTTEGGNTIYSTQNHTKMTKPARPTTSGNTEYTSQNYPTEISRPFDVTTEGSIENTSQNDYTKIPRPNGDNEKVPPNVDFNIKDITNTSFTLEWEQPKEIPGKLLKYYIVIMKKKWHYLRNECYIPYRKFEFSKEPYDDELSYKFTKARPNHLYRVKILAENENGNNTGMTKDVLTKSYKSTKPWNVVLTLNTHNICYPETQSYNVTLELKWELPCNTNGELVEFEINTSEACDIDDITSKITGNTRKYKVPKNPNIRDVKYGLNVENLNASCHYNVTITPVTSNHTLGDAALKISEKTKAGCPMEPREISSLSTNNSFRLQWREPEPFKGKILDYKVIILESGPKHPIPNFADCPKFLNLSNYKQATESTSLNFDQAQPNFIYFYQISARTASGTGKFSERKAVITQTGESEPIKDNHFTIKVDETILYEKYENRIQIRFEEPCNTNGRFLHYIIEIKGTRDGYPTTQHRIIKTERTETSLDQILREPEYHFEIAITVVTENHTSPTVSRAITTKAAIPTVNEKKVNNFMSENSPTSMKIVLEKDLFSNKNGDVRNYAIFLYEGVLKDSIPREPSFGSWNRTCSKVDETTYPLFEADHIYQVTDLLWKPFSGENKVSVFFGKKENCTKNNFCQPLKEKTNYIIVVRGFTKNTCRDVFIYFETGVSSSTSVGLFLVLIFILVLILLLGLYIHSKRTKFLVIRFRSIPNTTIEEAVPRHLIAVKHFKACYNKIQNDPTILRKQYEEIDDETKKYKEEYVKTTFALKPENKRKNRYTNILPYDEYRVKLSMDEDDEISSDYINASYIRGVSGEIEYIATQGPLEHTCKDFWKMVIQENITVIVMVSQFIEKEKEKCFKYFPNNHENMMICEDLEVKCLTELQFDTYCVRTLLVRKDLKRFSVVHMQYLDWPDFGCPSGTYNMLSFCEEVRERIQLEKGLMAVHCSAGVGRTGTLISLDILLQTMRRKKEISVFECVMDLRKQRTHMVQTEKQYVYLHTCLKDVLENSSLYSFDETKNTEEHVYQNITNERGRSVRGSQCEENESAF